MLTKISILATHKFKPRITVIGVGGAGGNFINNIITSHLEGVEIVVANTDFQALAQSLSKRRIKLGVNFSRGLGAGSQPYVGRAAAEEAIDEILTHLEGSNTVFIIAGMGGGTGTGGAPVVARAAREQGILTVGMVTKPFQFEGKHRMSIAEEGLEELQKYVDALIVIPNQNLFRVANEKTTFADAFKMADDVLYSGVRGVTELMVMLGLINLDFADVQSVMAEMGKAMVGTGEAQGKNRALAAAEAAMSNPLLEYFVMKDARVVLISITGGHDMTLFEVDEAANRIRDEVNTDANVIFGSTYDKALDGSMRVSLIAGKFANLPSDLILRRHSETEAVKRYRLAAEQGNTDAQNALGVMYENGEGVPQDYVQAMKWYRLAAEQGLADAQYNLASMYKNGVGVPQNYTEAVKRYRLAAEQGNTDAQYNLGFMYKNGEGVPQDYAEAMKWYRLAAEQGTADAQSNLGFMYGNGQGVPQDYLYGFGTEIA